MNRMRWILSFSLVTLFSLFSFAQMMSGVVMVVKGDVKITSKDGKTEAAKVGKKVTEGDAIIAGADSRAKIVMADKNVINVSPDSKIVIEKYQNDGKDNKNVELNVVYGKVRASVEQKYDGEKSKFNVKTPSAVAGVRGTDFITGYNRQTKSAQIITFSGSVAVGTPGPGGTIVNPVFVQPGQMTSVGSGQAPEPPKPVPSEELNQMNSETKTETASTGKQDSGEKSAEVKKEEKQEEKKEDKKESVAEKKEDKAADKADKKEAAAEKKEDKAADKADKKEAIAEKKDDKAADKAERKEDKAEKKADKKEPVADKRTEAKKEEPKQNNSGSGSGSGSGTGSASGPGSTSSSNTTAPPSPDQSRVPASTTVSMGPETLPATGSVIIPGTPTAPAVFVPPPVMPMLPPPTNTLIDNVIRNTQRSNTTIILNPQ